jgi:hypothetical protein
MLIFAISFSFVSPTFSQFWEEEENGKPEQTEKKEESSFGIWGEAPPDTTTSESKSGFWDIFKGEPEDSATAARKKMIEEADSEKNKEKFDSFGKDKFTNNDKNSDLKEYEGSTVLLTGTVLDEKGKPIQDNIYLINQYGKRKLCRANNEGIYKTVIPSGGYYNIYLKNRIVDNPVVVLKKTSKYTEVSHDFKADMIKEGSVVFCKNIFTSNQSQINTNLDTLKNLLGTYNHVSFTIEVNAPVIKEKAKKSKKSKKKKGKNQAEPTPKLDATIAQARIEQLEGTFAEMGINKKLYEIKAAEYNKQLPENCVTIKIKSITKLQ